MDFREFEAMEDVPYGLIACCVAGEQKHIMKISPYAVWIRTDVCCTPTEAELYFCTAVDGRYERLIVAVSEVLCAGESLGMPVYCMVIDDDAYASAVRRTLRRYADYVRVRTEEGMEGVAQKFSGYATEKDEVFCGSMDENMKMLSARFTELPRGDYELAVSLNSPKLYDLCMNTPGSRFGAVYCAHFGLHAELLSGRAIGRLYVGNAFCRHRLPDETGLCRILDKTTAEGLPVTLVLPTLRDTGEIWGLLDILSGREGCEVEVNDWGLLSVLRKEYPAITPVYGTRLNRYRRDPRVCQPLGEPCGNALDALFFRDYLLSRGIVRYEYEGGPQCPRPVGEHCSVHLPFYTAAVSEFCTLRAYCEHGDRGYQGPDTACGKHCENGGFLYPAHLGMLGVGNTVQCFEAERLSADGFDRVVLNFYR